MWEIRPLDRPARAAKPMICVLKKTIILILESFGCYNFILRGSGEALERFLKDIRAVCIWLLGCFFVIILFLEFLGAFLFIYCIYRLWVGS